MSGSEGVLHSSIPSLPEVAGSEVACAKGSVCCGDIVGLDIDGVGTSKLSRTSLPCQGTFIVLGTDG